MTHHGQSPKRTQKQLFALLFLSVVNVLLMVFLLKTAPAQSFVSLASQEQEPLRVTAVAPDDSPLTLAVVRTEFSVASQHTITFDLLNTSAKSIRAYSLTGSNHRGVSKMRTTFRVRNLIYPGESVQDEWFEVSENLSGNEPYSLTVDYVSYSDGTSWGADTQGQSETIAGYFAGQAKAVKAIRIYLDDRQLSAITDLIKLQQSAGVPIDVDSTRNAKWQTGFRDGYNGVLSHLRFALEKEGTSGISTTLKQIEDSQAQRVDRRKYPTR